MSIWYSKVVFYDRLGGPIRYERKIELDGWMDHIDVAAFLIGDWTSNQNQIKEISEKFTNLEDWKKDDEYDIFCKEEQSILEDSMSIQSEEFQSGIAKTKELVEMMFDRTQMPEQKFETFSEWED